MIADIGSKTRRYVRDFGDGWDLPIPSRALLIRCSLMPSDAVRRKTSGPWSYAEPLKARGDPSTNVTPNARIGSPPASIPNPPTSKGSPKRSPVLPNVSCQNPPANERA